MIIGKTSHTKKEKDYLVTLDFLKSKHVFDSSRCELENIVTGVESHQSANVYLANKVGNKILAKMTGQYVSSCSFKRKDQAVTMESKSNDRMALSMKLILRNYLII